MVMRKRIAKTRSERRIVVNAKPERSVAKVNPETLAMSPEVAQLEARLEELTRRLQALEGSGSAPAAEAPPAAQAAPPAPEEPTVTEEEILAVSAAIAAFLGVRHRIRQIRLVSTPMWAQAGRVSIQASHHLHN